MRTKGMPKCASVLSTPTRKALRVFATAEHLQRRLCASYCRCTGAPPAPRVAAYAARPRDEDGHRCTARPRTVRRVLWPTSCSAAGPRLAPGVMRGTPAQARRSDSRGRDTSGSGGGAPAPGRSSGMCIAGCSRRICAARVPCRFRSATSTGSRRGPSTWHSAAGRGACAGGG